MIVGGGTAGLALAARLAENTSLSIAVVEAGGFYEEDFGNILVVPGLGLTYTPPTTLLTSAFSAVDWALETTPQDGLQGQAYHYWHGRTLGGLVTGQSLPLKDSASKLFEICHPADSLVLNRLLTI